jgi:septum site-determining protein MinC
MRPSKHQPSKTPTQRRRAARIPLARTNRGAPTPATTAADLEREAPGKAGAPAAQVSDTKRPSCLFIDGNVRSGQTIEFTEGDVTVLGSVSSGAEIVAGGSIHVYGALRGRALAGVGGDRSARIICQRFEAELLAIDGRYRIAENLDPALHGHAIQARLEGVGMTLTRLD